MPSRILQTLLQYPGRLVRGSLAALLVVPMLAISALGASAEEGNSIDTRIVDVPFTGGTVTISGEGNCNSLSVTVNSPVTKDSNKAVQISYSVDDSCNVEVHPGQFVNSPGSGEAVSGKPSRTQSEATVEAISTKIQDTPSTQALGNYIHSNQTVQDVINVDIATYRYHTDRHWDGYSTWFDSDLWGEATASPSWNHAVDAVISYIGDAGSSTYSDSYGVFHSDFLWCNLQPGQDFVLTNRNTSYNDGRYAGTYWQSELCSGTHMATDTWANTNRYG